MGAARVPIGLEAMFAEDRAQRAWLGLVTTVQKRSLVGRHRLAEIAVALVLQKQIDGSTAHAQQLLQDAPLQLLQGSSRANRLLYLAGELVGQIHQNSALANHP